MTGRVAGKVALVTGGASGIGRATALLLAREGARVAVADIDANRARAVAAEIGAAAMALVLDVADPEAWPAAIKEIEERFGALNVLVHAAGMSLMKTVDELTVEEWRRVHAVNLDAIFLGTKAALPLMRRSGPGSIVMVSSSSGLQGKARLPAYASSKGGVRLFGKSVAMQLAREGVQIRCNIVFPGTVDTPMVRRSFGLGDGPEEAAKLLSQVTGIPLGRIGEADDIAYMILYLASDESKYVTGAEMVVDGGRTAGA
jgi:NAD(P)-dependent dehydrogenase (short-subunit alcohol dehydrogenase family)